MTPVEQSAVPERRPDWVGPLDGLSASARDHANRVLLDRSEQGLEAEERRLRLVAGGPAGLAPPQGWTVSRDLASGAVTSGVLASGLLAPGGPLPTPDVRAAYRVVLAKLASVRVVREVLAQQDGRVRQLLQIDVSGRLAKAVVSSGDIDRAGHVAVFTGGFSTTVSGDLQRYDRIMGRMTELSSRQAASYGDRQRVAAVTWLGYEAPQLSTVLDRRTSVATADAAKTAGAALADFANGLDAARAEPVHLTLWGHSYGSTTSGFALRDHNTGVDDLVVFGSPGIGVRASEQLHLPSGHLQVLEAPGDLVAELGRFGADPDQLEGAHQLSASPAVLPDGTTGIGSHGHREYLDPSTTSAWNLAAIAAGTPQVAVAAPFCSEPRHAVPRADGCR